jgi:hypothetical protein
MERILAAAAAGKTFTLARSNPKTGKSRERYGAYKEHAAFPGLGALRGVNFPGAARPVFRSGAMALSGDFSNSNSS